MHRNWMLPQWNSRENTHAARALSMGLMLGCVAWAGDDTPTGYGVNIHFTDERSNEVEMIAAAGCRWVRMDLFWERTERTPGVYEFEPYDRLVASLERYRIRALFILCYGNRLYDGGLAPHTETGRAAFARWAAAAVARYRGRGYLWEIWNEPNHRSFWKPQPNVANYVALARAVGRAVRAAAPGERLIGPATSEIDVEFLEACLRGGVLDDWWAVSVHPYRQSDPETVLPEYGRLRDLIRRYAPQGREVPILSGEWGYSVAWGGMSPDRQGMLLARQWLVNAAAGVPISIWYDWKDDGADPREPEHNFGTVRHRWLEGWPPFDPKPAWHAMRTFHRELDGYRFVRRVSWPRRSGESDPADWVLLFERAARWRLAMWTTSPGAAALLRLSGVQSIRSHLGLEWGPPPAVQASAEMEIRLRPEPLYVDIAPETAAELSRPTRWDWSDGRIEAIEVGGGPPGNLIIELHKSHGPAIRRGIVRLRTKEDTREGEWSAGEGETRVHWTSVVPAHDQPMRIEVTREDNTIIAVRSPFRLSPLEHWGRVPIQISANTDGRPSVAHELSLENVPASSDCPIAPASAVRMSIATAAGYQYFPLRFERPEDRRIQGRPTALVLWAKHEGDPLRLTCRVEDSRGQVFQPPHVRLRPGVGWKLLRLPLMGPGVAWWGGNGDGVPTPPFRWQAALLVDRDHAQGQTGTVMVAGAALLYDEDSSR